MNKKFVLCKSCIGNKGPWNQSGKSAVLFL